MTRRTALLLPWCEQAATMPAPLAERHLRAGLVSVAAIEADLSDREREYVFKLIDVGLPQLARVALQVSLRDRAVA